MEGISRGPFRQCRGALFPQRLHTLLVGDRPFIRKHSSVPRRICFKLARAIGAGVGWFPCLDRRVPLADPLGILGREARVVLVVRPTREDAARIQSAADRSRTMGGLKSREVAWLAGSVASEIDANRPVI